MSKFYGDLSGSEMNKGIIEFLEQLCDAFEKDWEQIENTGMMAMNIRFCVIPRELFERLDKLRARIEENPRPHDFEL